MQQQKLIEFIRQGRIAEALTFAQEELAPRGEESPEFLSELERTMALLAFESSPTAPPEISELLSPGQRMKTAGEVNAAILESLSQGKEVKLVGLLKLLCWGESMLEERLDFPKVSTFFFFFRFVSDRIADRFAEWYVAGQRQRERSEQLSYIFFVLIQTYVSMLGSIIYQPGAREPTTLGC
jgi:CTLH/CRA C-terminal to LisH motif domain